MQILTYFAWLLLLTAGLLLFAMFVGKHYADRAPYRRAHDELDEHDPRYHCPRREIWTDLDRDRYREQLRNKVIRLRQ